MLIIKKILIIITTTLLDVANAQPAQPFDFSYKMLVCRGVGFSGMTCSYDIRPFTIFVSEL